MSEVANYEDMENALQCPVCMDEYNLNERVPRRLPCTHLACGSCISEILGRSRTLNVNCPTCREPHPAPRDELTFPQDSALVAFVRPRVAQTQEEPRMCQQHGQEVILYCTECLVSFCLQCKTDGGHDGHNVVDLKQLTAETSRNLRRDTHSLQKKLGSRKQNLCGVKVKLKQKFEESSNKLDEEERRFKEDLQIRRRRLAETYREGQTRLLFDIDQVDEVQARVQNISRGYNPNTASYNNVNNRWRVVKQMETYTKSTMAESAYIYFAPNHEEERYLENVLSKQKYEVPLDTLVPLNVVTRACELDCIVTQQFATNNRTLSGMNLLREDSVMVWAQDDVRNNLVEYDLRTGREYWSERGGRAGVYLPDVNCLAVSYTEEGKMEFYDVGTLNHATPPYTPSKPFSPTVMCLAQPGTMFVMDRFNTQSQIRQLDYTHWPPRLHEPSVIVRNEDILDICFMKNCKIVLACGEKGVSVYNIKSRKLEWNVKGELLGMQRDINIKAVSVNEFGHIFACDFTNACIHMFTSEGTYLGVVMKEGEQNLGNPSGVCFRKNPPSLVVCHKRGEFWEVSVFEINNPLKEREEPKSYTQFGKFYDWAYEWFFGMWPFRRSIQN